jgi:aldehyde:ferredoxin oxidoreductase
MPNQHKIIMPEEFNNREYIVKAQKMGRKVQDLLQESRTNRNWDYLDYIIPNWVIKPPITVEDIKEDRVDLEEMIVLSTKITELNTISSERIEELQKKTKTLSL